jgi:hypothetical protein
VASGKTAFIEVSATPGTVGTGCLLSAILAFTNGRANSLLYLKRGSGRVTARFIRARETSAAQFRLESTLTGLLLPELLRWQMLFYTAVSFDEGH